MNPQRDVVITGMGVVSPIGIGRAAFAESLRTGRSGVAPLQVIDSRHMAVRIGGEIADFDGKQYIQPRKSIKVMCREIQFAFAAATLAMGDAGLTAKSLDPDRVGVVLGADFIYMSLDEPEPAYRYCTPNGKFDFDRWGTGGMQQMNPLWMLKYLPNMAACHIGIAQDARGPNNTITLGDVSSLLAIGEATRIIERGHADVMLCGGTGSRLDVTGLAWRGDSNLSHRNDDPAAASRPFDAARDGMVNGEGAGVLVLETRQHAQARGAKILARVLGTASSFESRYGQQPRTGAGLRRAVETALKSAATSPSEIGHVNASGVSIVAEDAIEAGVIHKLLNNVPVTAPKSFFGNLGGGSGTVELAASLLGLASGEVPITLNYETPDPACPINVVHGDPAKSDRPAMLKISESRTGQSACLVLGRP